MKLKLEKSKIFDPVAGSVVTVILDGVGLSPHKIGNAVESANMPFYKSLFGKYPWIKLKAHGTAVGLPTDSDMGNSEVGHNAMGAGRIFVQGAKLVNEAIKSGEIWRGQVWQDIISINKLGGTLHLMGLLSDGNVHSHINHLKALIKQAKIEKFGKVRLHILLDGRDVGETSALKYIDDIEEFMDNLRDDKFDVEIASGGGRMVITMDRYGADWGMVERGWKVQVLGEGRQFGSAKEAVETLRKENSGVIDQNLSEFIIAKNGNAVGQINDGDAVIFFNFRGDRAIEISRAFEEKDFLKFDRVKWPKVIFAGIMQYDGDLKIPKIFLVQPPAIDRTLSEYLSANGITEYVISETQKFGHVTYFWNGNWSGKFNKNLEFYEEVPSDLIPFEKQPAMKAKEITDRLIEAVKSRTYKYLRVNYPNGDMVGHTGNFEATVKAMEALDIELKKLVETVLAKNGVIMITADHGNAEEMYEIDKNGNLIKDDDGNYKAKTSHTLNPVAFILITDFSKMHFELNTNKKNGELSNIAATVINLLGFEAPTDYDESLIVKK